ncbi:hypothetical protein GCM10027020_32320 [Nocardioides salsibiostraticola]
MPELTYTARGRGCEVRLACEGSGDLRVSAAGLEDPAPEVVGSPELLENLALVSLVLAFTANELAYRRLRSPEKRTSHQAASAAAAKDAVALVQLILRLELTEKAGWCSGCFEKTAHRHVKGHDRPRRKYLCANCGTPTTQCAVPRCPHLAVVKPSALLTLRYCAEHHHQIAGFEKMTERLPRLTAVEEWLTFESRNAKRITTVAGGTIAAAAVVAPMALLAAPVAGAALGSSFLGGSLTGAAATSHGLAMLGGGAIASGGLGMAGGTMVVTATGTALGGILGAGTAAAYVGSDSSFRIELLRDGVGAPVLLASGFLTENDDGWGHWQPMIDARFPESPVYRVHWGAKELKDVAALVALSSSKTAVRVVLTNLAKRGSKSLGRLPGLGAALSAHDIIANPWSVAKNRAEMTGAVLADLIARTEEGPVILVGHSLGARAMVTAAQALGTRPGDPHVESMHLLGAAVGKAGDWRTLNDAVSGTIWNYYSTRDSVLRLLFSTAERGKRAVGHSGFASKFPRVKDRNVSRQVAGHSEYVTKVTLA